MTLVVMAKMMTVTDSLTKTLSLVPVVRVSVPLEHIVSRVQKPLVSH